tara:strand:- start:2997 stop:6245 length:3249 start_codon:yes stop_codon:yes gene_type:complete
MTHVQAQPRKAYAEAASLEVFHTGGPVRLSPDGTLVATACVESVNIVEVATGRVVHCLEGDTEPVTALAWSKDGGLVFSASRSMRCTVWDTHTGKSVRHFKAHATPVLHMAVDPSGTLLVTTSADRTARVWDVAKGFCTHAFKGHAAMVTVAQFHPDPRRLELYTGAHDGEIRVWSLRDRKCVGSMNAHTSSVTALAVPMAAAGGTDVLLSAGRDNVVHQWNLKTHKHVATVPTHEACEGMVAVDQVAAARMIGAKELKNKPESVYFATAGEKGIVRVWRVGSGKPIGESHSLRHGTTKGGAHAGQLVDEAGDDAAAAAFTSLHATPSGDGFLAVTGDSRLLFYGAGNVDVNGAEVSDQASITVTRELIGSTDEIIAAAFLPGAGGESSAKGKGKKASALAVATNSPLLRVFDPNTMACTVALTGHAGAILTLDAARGPCGEALVITGSRDHTVRLWDLTPAAAALTSGDDERRLAGTANNAGCRCLAIGEGHVGAVAAVAFAQRGGAPIALSGGADKVARVWDIAAAVKAAAKCEPGELPISLPAKAAAIAHDKSVNCTAIAPNGAFGATCSGDRTARLWRLPDLVPAGAYRGHKRGVWAVAFSPTDRVVATAGGDKVIKLWTVDPTAGAQGAACLRTLEGHTAAVLALRFVTSGTQLLSTGGDGLLMLWGVRQGAQVATIDAHDDKAWALATDADGDFIATGGADAKLTLWKDATQAAFDEAAAVSAKQTGAAQALSNAAASGHHEKAARLALKLNHPHALLKAINAMLLDPNFGDAALDQLTATVKGKALHRLLSATREWNSNARHCDAAQRVLASLLRLRSLDELSTVPGAADLVSALTAYTQRHFARAGRLLRGTYLLDVALAGMGALLDDEEGGGLENLENAENANGAEKVALAGVGGVVAGAAGDDDGLIARMVRSWGGDAPAFLVDQVNLAGAGLGAAVKPAVRAPTLTRVTTLAEGDDADDLVLDGDELDPEDEEIDDDDDEESEDDALDTIAENASDSESESEPAPVPVITKKASKPSKGKSKPGVSPRKTRGQRVKESESPAPSPPRQVKQGKRKATAGTESAKKTKRSAR